jgi:hypothetical protein
MIFVYPYLRRLDQLAHLFLKVLDAVLQLRLHAEALVKFVRRLR